MHELESKGKKKCQSGAEQEQQQHRRKHGISLTNIVLEVLSILRDR